MNERGFGRSLKQQLTSTHLLLMVIVATPLHVQAFTRTTVQLVREVVCAALQGIVEQAHCHPLIVPVATVAFEQTI